MTTRRSTIDAFFETARRLGGRIALRHRVAGAWQETSWTEYARLVRRAARALVHLGVPVGGAVNIVGPNRPEWVIADLAAMAAGGVAAPIYPTLTDEGVAFVAAHSEARVAVVHDERQLAKLRTHRERLPHLRHVVLMEGQGDGEPRWSGTACRTGAGGAEPSLGSALEVLSWRDFLALGDRVTDEQLDRRLEAIRPEDTATLIYTSGTTGTPKAVMIPHRNLLFIGEANDGSIRATDADHLLSYLPMSHIAEQMLSIHIAAVAGYTVSFCEKLDELPVHLREVRPTVFFGVPRVWEKLQAKMVEAGAASPWAKKKIAAWARSVGLRAGYAKMRGAPTPLGYGLAQKVVYSKVREKLGLDRAWFCVSGAAAIGKSTLEFFLSLDIPIYEVYGMSESTGPAAINRVDAYRLGTVGQVIPGTEIKLAPYGEILMHGPHVFSGYMKDEAATREALDAEGWLHSGDVGEMDGDGFLRVTDRKKDLFKTAGGKYIAPQRLEGLLKALPGVGQAVAIGDGRRYVTALLTLDPEAAAREAEKHGIGARTVDELARDRAFLALLDSQLQELNAGLASFETVKRIKVLPVEFTIESGELTPTLKVKRKVVGERYAGEIESLYRD